MHSVPSLSTIAGRVPLVFLMLPFILALGLGSVASAVDVLPGQDFFVTQPGTQVDLAGFGLGIVPLEGVELDPSLNGADTIVQRLAAAPDPAGIISIELVELELRSVAPVDLTPLGGPFIGVFSDLYITVDGLNLPNVPQYSPLNPSIGQMQILHDAPGSATGTFISCLGDPGDPEGSCNVLGVGGGGVYADAIFVVPGGDPNNPLDVLINTPAPRVAVAAINAQWDHPTGLVPPAGPFAGASANFRILNITHVGPHPVAPAFPAVSLVPALSLPGLLTVIGISGAIGIGALRRARRLS
jgi:hypothetical protein